MSGLSSILRLWLWHTWWCLVDDLVDAEWDRLVLCMLCLVGIHSDVMGSKWVHGWPVVIVGGSYRTLIMNHHMRCLFERIVAGSLWMEDLLGLNLLRRALLSRCSILELRVWWAVIGCELAGKREGRLTFVALKSMQCYIDNITKWIVLFENISRG